MTDDAERQRVLELYQGLRVADVRDALDWLGLHHYGSMSPGMRPLWRARACGLARTARYLPYDGRIPPMTAEEYTEWVGWYYREICPYPWIRPIQPGDFCVIDQSGADAGLMGSGNTLTCAGLGATGFVTNGGVRDTDEIIIQRIPFWSRLVSQSMVQGRLRFDAMDIPVSVGGVMVNPGDVTVADGDGVIVVPRALADEVAGRARRQLEEDRAGRRELYEQQGRAFDHTVGDGAPPGA